MDVQQLIELGNEHRKAKDYACALDCYQRALDLDPANRTLMLAMGADAYRGLNDYENSLRLWMMGIENFPKDVPTLTRIADAHKRLGRRDLAVAFYHKALGLQKTNRYALMGLGDLHYKERNYKDALTAWEQLLQIDPRLINIITMVGNIHRKLHNFEKAVDYFSAALKIAPHNNYAVFGMADALRGLGRYEQAAPYWDEIVREDPENAQVLTRAGDCFFRIGDLAKAERLFRQATAIGDDIPALRGLARIQKQRGEFELAARNYESILSLNPDDMHTISLLGETLAESEGNASALAYLRNQLVAHPDSKEIQCAIQRLEGHP